jgi:adenylosuccinate synthase
MRNKVVIGANFGDEGKGLMTDYFVSQFKGKCTVVRFNGGAQAGHTVVTPEGKRHKFSHFGAGSLFGAPTYLSRFFLVNPILFMKELEELDFLPEVYVDDNCLVSTPYDMHINQMEELARGDKRHGSCGFGINETIERSSKEEFCLKAEDLRFNIWKEKLEDIAYDYYPQRLKELGQPNPMFDFAKIAQVFIDFRGRVAICDHAIIEDEDLVFEGAQGLMLDQNHKFFPHVTRSNTGFENVKTLLGEMGRTGDDTEVVYVTRSYLTRHGRGPLPTEVYKPLYKGIVDDTNVYNEFQEDLRFGILDLLSLCSRIEEEIRKNELERVSMAMTCLDQVDDDIVFYGNAILLRKPIDYFLRTLNNRLPCSQIYASYGRTRADVKCVKPRNSAGECDSYKVEVPSSNLGGATNNF